MYEIIKNAPPMASGRSKYRFAEMEIMDAFDAPDDMGKRNGASIRQNVIGSCARIWAKKYSPGAKFSVRKQPGGIIRCQRIA